MVLKFLNSLLLWYLLLNFLYASMQWITNSEDPSLTPLQTMKMLPGTRLWYPYIIPWSHLGQVNSNVRYCFWHPNEGWTLEKIANDREGSRHRNYDAAFKLILRIIKGFHKSKRNLYVYFSLGPNILITINILFKSPEF